MAPRNDGPPPPEFKGNQRFHLLKRLGEGGSGVVYLAHDLQREASVALKTLTRMKPTALFRFKSEFRALADIHHPHLVGLHELVNDEGTWFFVMDYVEGRSFDEVIGDRPGLELLRPLLQQTAKGLHALHRAGKLHRDLKPENVIITPEQHAVILDFGLVTDERRRSHGTVDEGWIEGTPSFMSPEQALGDPLTTASDWYAFGVILHEILTGKLPFVADYPEVLFRKVEEDPKPPSFHNPNIPRDLDQLCHRLLNRDPSKRPRGDEVLSTLRRNRPASVEISVADMVGPSVDASFVGRGPQLAILDGTLAATDSGKPTLVLLSALAGLGKSALVEHFLDQAEEQRQAVTLRGRCYERETVPFKAFDSLVDDLARYLRQLDDVAVAALLPRRVDALAKVFPVLSRVERIAQHHERQPLDADPLVVRRQAFDALKELLGRMADLRPLVLFVDDLHWGDEDSADLFEALVTGNEAPALMMIGAYRSEAARHSACVERLQQLGETLGVRGRAMELQPLTEQQAAQLLETASVGATLLDSQALAVESGGNPYYLGELVRMARERTPGAGPDSSPPTMADVIADRLSRVSPQAQRLMEVIAVASVPVSQDMLRLCSEEGADLHGALKELREQRLVRRGGEDSDGVTAHHNLIRDYICENLEQERQRSLHLRIAEALEVDGSEDFEALATHLIGAGEPQRAMGYAVRGAQRAEQGLAFDQAARLYRMAVDHRDEDSIRSQLRMSLAGVLKLAGKPEAAAMVFLEAAGATPEEGMRWRRLAGETLAYSGRVAEGLELLAETLEDLGIDIPESEDEAVGEAVELWDVIHKRGLDYETQSEEQLDPAFRDRLDLLWTVAFGSSAARAPHTLHVVCLHLLDALEAGVPIRLLRALTLFHRVVDQPVSSRVGRDVVGALDLARTLSAELSDPYGEAAVRGAEAGQAFNEGRWDVAVELTRLAEHLLRTKCSEVEPERELCLELMSTVRSVEGKWTQDAHAPHAQFKRGQGYVNFIDQLAPVRDALLRNDPDEALDRLDAEDDASRDATAVRRFLGVHFTRCCWARYERDAETCLELADQVQEFMDSAVGGLPVYRAIALWTRLANRLTAANQTQDRGPLLEQVATDLEELEGLAMPCFDPTLVLSRAALSHLRGERERAEALLDGAASLLANTPRGLMADLRLGGLSEDPQHRHRMQAAEYALKDASVQCPQHFAEIFAPGLRPLAEQ